MRRRDILRANKRMKKIRWDQTYQSQLIQALKEKLASEEPWLELILGTDDPKVAASISDFDQRHAAVKARHVIDALEEMRLSIESNSPITWKDSCVKSGQSNYCGVGHRRIMAWYRDMHTTTTGDLRFTKSARGASSSEDCPPFRKDKVFLSSSRPGQDLIWRN